MACPNCGASIKPAAKFCGSCGSKLSASDEGNPAYPNIVSSTPNPMGLPPCQFKLLETKGEGPDDDGDIRIELKYSVTNNTDQVWDYLAVTTQLVNFDGQVIEQSTDSFEQTLEPSDDTELDVYFGAANLKLLGQHPENSIIVSTITACKAEFASLGAIDIPAEAFQVSSIAPIRLGDTAQLLSGSVYKTEPDSDKDCQVQVKALIQNLTNLPLHEVKIIADVTDKSGRELCDAGGYEQIRPDEICLIQGNGYTKEKSLKAAKVELSIRSYTPVAVSTIQTNGLDLSELSNNESEEKNSSSSWSFPFESSEADSEHEDSDNKSRLIFLEFAVCKNNFEDKEISFWNDDLPKFIDFNESLISGGVRNYITCAKSNDLFIGLSLFRSDYSEPKIIIFEGDTAIENAVAELRKFINSCLPSAEDSVINDLVAFTIHGDVDFSELTEESEANWDFVLDQDFIIPSHDASNKVFLELEIYNAEVNFENKKFEYDESAISNLKDANDFINIVAVQT